MELEITPEPTGDERAAIEAALTALLAESAATRSPWWQAGVLDAADEEETNGQDVAGPLSSRGAARA